MILQKVVQVHESILSISIYPTISILKKICKYVWSTHLWLAWQWWVQMLNLVPMSLLHSKHTLCTHIPYPPGLSHLWIWVPKDYTVSNVNVFKEESSFCSRSWLLSFLIWSFCFLQNCIIHFYPSPPYGYFDILF